MKLVAALGLALVATEVAASAQPRHDNDVYARLAARSQQRRAPQNNRAKGGKGQGKNNGGQNNGGQTGGGGQNNGGQGNGNNGGGNAGGLEGTIRAALATTLQKQIDLFNQNQALVQKATNGQFTDNSGGKGDNSVSQTSTTLDDSLVQVGSFQDGGAAPGAEGGQALPLTSKNNFINFCATQQTPLQNGLQFRGQATCNEIPMGAFPSSDKTPTAVFTSPLNNANVKTGAVINLQAKISNMELGSFSNAQSTYYNQPQILNAQGQIVGHTHITCSQIKSLTATDVIDSKDFIFFKGINAPPANGVLTASIATGLFAGTFRCCTMTSSTTHQPVLVNVAQRVGQDDCIRFTVSDNGDANAGIGDADAAKQTADFLAKAAADFAAANPAAGGAAPSPAATSANNGAGGAASTPAASTGNGNGNGGAATTSAPASGNTGAAGGNKGGNKFGQGGNKFGQGGKFGGKGGKFGGKGGQKVQTQAASAAANANTSVPSVSSAPAASQEGGNGEQSDGGATSTANASAPAATDGASATNTSTESAADSSPTGGAAAPASSAATGQNNNGKGSGFGQGGSGKFGGGGGKFGKFGGGNRGNRRMERRHGSRQVHV